MVDRKRTVAVAVVAVAVVAVAVVVGMKTSSLYIIHIFYIFVAGLYVRFV
jgi:hypothetical protein